MNIEENEESYICHLCDSVFRNNSNLIRHLKKQKACVEFDRIKLNQKLKNYKNNNNYNHNNISNNIYINQHIDQHIENHNQIDQHNEILINNINVHPFGQENMDYILEEESLEACLSLENFEKYIKNIHMNDNHPENHNIYLKSGKQKEYYVLTENGRQIEKERELSRKVLSNNINRLKYYKNEYIDNFDKDERNRIISFINQAESLDKSAIRVIKNALLNTRELIKLQPNWCKNSLLQ